MHSALYCTFSLRNEIHKKRYEIVIGIRQNGVIKSDWFDKSRYCKYIA